MSLIITEEKAINHRAKNAVEKHRDELVRWIEQEEAQQIELSGHGVDLGNWEHQLGKPMNSAQMEALLGKYLPPTIWFADNPGNRTKKAIMRLVEGKPEMICAYERGFMPERSVLRVYYRDIADKDYIAKRKVMQRADLPKWGYKKDGSIEFDAEAIRPGFKRQKFYGGETVRGWRTVILRLVQKNVLTVYQAESIFGAANTAAWAQFTGKSHRLVA